MSPKQNTCKSCCYWYKAENFTGGHCQRYPPEIVRISGEALTLFPETFPEWWCGEHKPKKASDLNG